VIDVSQSGYPSKAWKDRLGDDHLIVLDLVDQISGNRIKAPERTWTEPIHQFLRAFVVTFLAATLLSLGGAVA
jgi:hypothetical protein